MSSHLGAAFAAATATLPTLLLLGRTGWRRLRHGADTGRVRRESGAGIKGRLRAARKSAAGRRLHVSFAMGQAGWALLVTSLTLASTESAAIQPVMAGFGGNAPLWLVPAPLGICLFLLALFPTDARFIRVVSATLLAVCTGLGALSTLSALTNRVPDIFGFGLACKDFATACALVPTLRGCRGYRAMQPRPALRWLWTLTRLNLLGVGVLFAGFNFADFAQGGNNLHHWAGAGLSATSLLMAALATPRNRGRIHRRLGRLGARESDAEEAAAIAALVGGSDSDDTLERAMDLFRCLPAGRLYAADLANNTTAPPQAGPTLHARTEPAAMGEVTAFLSHSWSDEQESPGAKHTVVSRWAERQQEMTGTEPTLWLVALARSHLPAACTLGKLAHLALRRRTRRASTRPTSSSRSPACPSSSQAAGRFSLWLGPRTAQGYGVSWSSSRSCAVIACT